MVFLSYICKSYGQKILFVTENNPPLQITDKGKPLTGFAIELVESVIDKAGINAIIQAYPWARSYIMAQEKPNVFIFSISRTKERENLFQWVGTYYKETDAFFALASRKDIVLNSIEDAKKYKTAVPRGDASALRLEKHGFTKIHLYYVTDQKQSIQKLKLGRVDLISNNTSNSTNPTFGSNLVWLAGMPDIHRLKV